MALVDNKTSQNHGPWTSLALQISGSQFYVYAKLFLVLIL